MANTGEKAATQPGGAMLSPYDYGRKLGLVRASKVTINGVKREFKLPSFRAAEVLHGWTSHSKHTADPLTISRDAFDAALVAVSEADSRGNYTPHAAALAPHLRGKTK